MKKHTLKIILLAAIVLVLIVSLFLDGGDSSAMLGDRVREVAGFVGA